MEIKPLQVSTETASSLSMKLYLHYCPRGYCANVSHLKDQLDGNWYEVAGMRADMGVLFHETKADCTSPTVGLP